MKQVKHISYISRFATPYPFLPDLIVSRAFVRGVYEENLQIESETRL